MSDLATMERPETSSARELLTITIGEQIFGIPILQVQDVLGAQKVTRVPLAPKAVAGSLNLRGRIVTAIDMRACLGMMIDRVGDVMNLPYSAYEKNPATLNPQWRAMCQGIYRLKDKLLVVLDVPRLLEGLQTS
jgi:purine-binding chemotaxis protein CheW